MSSAASSSIASLYPHVLHCVFSFLPLPDLQQIVAVSQSWAREVSAMPRLERALALSHFRATSVLDVMSRSRLRKHIARISAPNGCELSLTRETLALVAASMPHLMSLRCRLEGRRGPAEPKLPASLTELHLSLFRACKSNECPRLIDAISALHGLRALHLHLPEIHRDWSFAVWSQLGDLTRLKLVWEEPSDPPSDEHIAQFRSLSGLQHLTIGSMTHAILDRLLAPPVEAIRWQSLGDPLTWLDQPVAECLGRLSTITELYCSMAASLDCLPCWRGLKDVRIVLDPALRSSEVILAAFRNTTLLERLSLTRSEMNTAEVASILSRQPNLASLALSKFPRIDRLTFLRDCPRLAESLTELTVVHTALLPLADLACINVLQSLRSLMLDVLFEPCFNPETQAAYEPPSKLLPKLREFLYIGSEPEYED